MFRQLCREVVATMERIHVPGVAVGLIDGDVEHVAGFGVTNIHHPLPIDADTLFQIGSTTKTVTGTAAMRLVEQGRLDSRYPHPRLSARTCASPARRSRPASRSGTCSTIPAAGSATTSTTWGTATTPWRRSWIELADLPQLTPLGEVWSYNNAGFYLAGRVIEVVTGKPYEAVAKELVLDPLGMAMSFFFAADAITYRVASGHEILTQRARQA